MSSQPAATDHDLDAVARAQYLAWSRVWEAAGRLASMRPFRMEERLADFFCTVSARVEPTHVLEIGAHEASFSKWAAEHLPAARVTAFEANPYVYEEYAAELAATRVDYLNLAVGPVSGEVELLLPRSVGGAYRSRASRMGSLQAHTRAGKVERVTVPSVRLEDHVRLGEGDRVVSWIDVEGATRQVLEGSGSLLDRTHAAMVEVESTEKWEGQWLDVDVAAFLRSHGLVPLVRDLTPRPDQYNVIFVRAEHADDPDLVQGAARVMRRTKREPEGS